MFFDPETELDIGPDDPRFDKVSPEDNIKDRAKIVEIRWLASLRGGITTILTTLETVKGPDVERLGIRGSDLENRIVRTLDRVAPTLVSLGVSPPFCIFVTLVEVRNCYLEEVSSVTSGFEQPTVELKEAIVENGSGPLGTELRPVLDELWHAAGWKKGSPSYKLASGRATKLCDRGPPLPEERICYRSYHFGPYRKN